SEKMRAQITGLTRATQNAQDGVSLVQTAEGNLTEVHSMLNRMVDLATQSSNGTIDDNVDRKNLQKEVQSLKDEINRIAESSHFNGIKLLDGSLGGYKSSATAITGTSVSALVEGSTINITGGALKTGDNFSVAFTTANNGSFTIGAITIGGKSYANIGALTAAGLKVTITSGDGTTTTNSLSLTSGGGGTYTVKIELDKEASDTVKKGVTEDLRNAVVNGITIEAKINETLTGKENLSASNFTIKGDAGKVAKGGGLNLQIGDTPEQRVQVKVIDMGVKNLGLTDVDVSSEPNASKSINKIKNAINTVSGQRADLGAIQNRLEHTINNLTTTSENMTAAESRIRDTDMAKEMMAFTKNNVLSQAAQAMLAQANQQPQQVLQLLR
ncbi:MAG: flagellin, partial [Oscillospiraceae bacterium]